MPPTGFPLPLVQGLLTITPEPVLALLLEIFVRRIKRLHPRLFTNLERLDDAVVHIEPSDAPHRFALKLGSLGPDLEVLDEDDKARPDACVAGPTAALVDMLEGRLDGDMLFFSRGITVTGDTAVIVALRNTLDREDFNLWDDAFSFFGPMALPAKAATRVAERVLRRQAGRR